MNGLLKENPLIEIIREIKANEMGGALRLSQERVKCAFSFDGGSVVFAASNHRALRLRETFLRWKLIHESKLPEGSSELSDSDFVQSLENSGLADQELTEAGLVRQAEDILRTALLWTDGEWDFDPRIRLGGDARYRLDPGKIIFEAAHRLEPAYGSSRIDNVNDMIDLSTPDWTEGGLTPSEAFLLTRIERPLRVYDVLSLSGLPEIETLHHLYCLAVGGFIECTGWPRIFDDELVAISKKRVESNGRPAREFRQRPKSEITLQPPAPVVEQSDSNQELEELFQLLSQAETHYQVLGVVRTADAREIKRAYISMARRYHPDKFHHMGETAIRGQIESAFARIARAYETLSNQSLKAGYDLQISRATPSAPAESPSPTDPQAESASKLGSSPQAPSGLEAKFQAGLAALKDGKIQFAISFLEDVAAQEPSNAIFRAYYGKALAGSAPSRLRAESELKAAISLEPRNSLFHLMLAEFYMSVGLLKRAQTCLETALSLEPGNTQARAMLENVKAKMPRQSSQR